MTSAAFDDERIDGSTHVVAVAGEVDATNVADLRRRVTAALDDGCERLVIDLAGVTYMDSSGLAELIGTRRRANESGAALALVVATPHVERILEIRGVRKLFTVADTRDAALAALA